MKIDLTFGQLVAMCHHFGYGKMLPANEGYIDTDANKLIMYGAVCPIDHDLTKNMTLKEIDAAKDQWKVEVAEKPETRSVWMRLGVTVSGRASDIDAIVQGGENSDGILADLLKRGSYRIDGDSYIPETCVEDYNEEYNTNHEVGDVEFNL